MVQVSYPGVYIKEVPSGSRTITGVSTSITAFVGVTKRGPVGDPVAVLSYSDYVRNFSDDTQVSEMTDQVRQFFLNGGQQAYVMRIAATSSPAKVELAAPHLVLFAKSDGDDGNNLRAKVDYDTAEPNRTFNLTVYRESISATGTGEVVESETLKGLSMDPQSIRNAVAIINRDSKLCNAEGTTPTAAAGVSLAGRLFANTGTPSTTNYYVGAAAAIRKARNLGVAATFTGRFSITVGTVTKIVNVTELSFADNAALQSAVTSAFAGTGITVTVADIVGADYSTISFTAGSALDLKIESIPDTSLDIASILQLGTAQGGIEYGAYAASRPVPNGVTSKLGVAPAGATALVHFAETAPSAGTLELVGSSNAFSIAFAVPVGWGTVIGQSQTDGTVSLANASAYLENVASTINSSSNNKGWHADVQGLRLVLTATFGDANSGVGYYVNAGPAWFIDTGTGTDGLFPIVTATTPDIAKATKSLALALSLWDGKAVTTGLTPATYATAFSALESKVDLFNLLVLPRTFGQDLTEDVRTDVWANASAFCKDNRAFLLIDPTVTAVGQNSSIDNALNAVKTNRFGIVKDHSAMYWPRIAIKPESSKRHVDPSGTIAGLMARIDGSRGVWKAPAGTEADLRGVFGVETPMSDRENGRLNPEALNCIRAFTSGIISWGARTMDGYDNSGNDDYKYVPVRRFALFLEESLYRGLQWAVFEPNDQRLWSQIRMTVSSFMNGLYRQGAFFGETSKEAYFVKVDAETTTPNDINLGICNVIVGFAPVKPAEFIVVTIKQKAGQVQV